MIGSSQGYPTPLYSLKKRQYFDPIHNYIELEDYCWQIIDTDVFQRLRDIKQLGISYLVFPSARHTRFEHSVGVAHLAKEQMLAIKQKQGEELDINEEDIKKVTLAGLCHDLGHGPFSHLFDNHVMSKLYPELKWTHELASTQLIDLIVEREGVDLDSIDIGAIKNFIVGENRFKSSLAPSQKWMYEIISNERNKIDVDKFDYIRRDPFMAGFKTAGYECAILIQNARVMNNQICYPSKSANHVYDLFISRQNLHKQIYQNQRVHEYECSVVDLLFEANSYFKYNEIVADAERYVEFTDNILYEIQWSQEPELAAARNKLKKMQQGQIFKMVGQHITTDETEKEILHSITAEDIVNCSDGGDNLKQEDLQIKCFEINFACGNENPVDRVMFFSEKKIEEGPYKIQKSKVSFLIPDHFSETYFRLFVRNPEMKIAAGRAMERTLKEQGLFKIRKIGVKIQATP